MSRTAETARRVVRSVAAGLSPARLFALLAVVTAVLLTLAVWLGRGIALAAVGFVVGIFAVQLIELLPKSVLRFLKPPKRRQLSGEKFQIGGVTLGAEIVDLPPGGYHPSDLDVRVTGARLNVPQAVQRSADVLAQILTDRPPGKDVVFDNNACLVVATPPSINREERGASERPGVSFDVAETEYFVKALARGCPPKSIVELVDTNWPSGVLRPLDVRSWLLQEKPEGFDPLAAPNFGLTLALTLRWGKWGENRAGVYQLRGRQTATNPGRLGVPISEAFSLSDKDQHSQFVSVEAAAKRAAGEELGLPAHEASVSISGLVLDIFGTGRIDANGARSAGGYNFVGFVEAEMSPDQFSELQPRDRFENGELHSYPLTASGVADALMSAAPGQWFPPAVVAMVAALDDFDQNGSQKVGALLLDRNWAAQSS